MKRHHPTLIQGGMGIAVSDWRLARAVSLRGELGVVSGTAINSVLVRRLQDGDPSGVIRRALAAFPSQDISRKILKDYFLEGGRQENQPYKRAPLYAIDSSRTLLQLTVAACFVEVFLAKENHQGVVGLNLLEKVQLPNLACLYGALLAGVDYVIMGAGIPREIPGALDLLSLHQKASLKIPVSQSEDVLTFFDPAEVMEGLPAISLKRPFFFPIVSSSVLATSLKKKSTGEVNGFIVEGPLAGGHNAPPRGPLTLTPRGEPIYGHRDVVAFEDMSALGLPYWIAGDCATPEKFQEVRRQGAHGIQVGTLFAFSDESGLKEKLKRDTLRALLHQSPPEGGWVFTDPRSSPTGFPFKAVRLPGTISDQNIYESRKRICDLGYLRHAYRTEDGRIGQRCPAEPTKDYLKKGGLLEDTVGRKCLCNALMADVDMAQIQSGSTEISLLTAGDDLNKITRLLKNGKDSYSVADVISYLAGEITARPEETLLEGSL